PLNLGFVIYNYNRTDDHPDGNHEYTSYYMSDDIIYRIKCRTADEEYPNSEYFTAKSGVNFICENIKENNTTIDFEANIIDLNFIVRNKEFSYEFKSIFNMSCLTDY